MPTDAIGWLNLAYAYQKQGKYMATVKVLERVESLQSKSATNEPKQETKAPEATNSVSQTTTDPDVFIKAQSRANRMEFS